MACACVSPVYLRYIDSLGQQPDRLYPLPWVGLPAASALWRLSCAPFLLPTSTAYGARPTDISTLNLTVGSLSGVCSLLIKLGSFDWICKGSGANANGCGGFAVGIKRTVLWALAVLVAFPLLVMLWVLVLALALVIQLLVLVVMQLPLYWRRTLPSRQEWFAFLGVHVNVPMRSAVRAKSYLSSPTPKILSRIRFLRMFYCTRAKIP